MPTFFNPGAPLLFIGLLTTCASGPGSDGEAPVVDQGRSAEFGAYWYQGKAELDRYDLVQARYGELRNGTALLVFVTEDFLTQEHVKYEGLGDGPRASVLKLNRIDRFNTGIYDYSLMTSVFSAVDEGPALKVTCTVQDWCGQAFMQVDDRADGIHVQSRSYFEREGDVDGVIGKVWLEDALWNQVRIDPEHLPSGELEVLPSLGYLRLMHRPHQAVRAQARSATDGEFGVYTLEFPSLDRVLEIRYETAFPHTIAAWSETRPDGFGPDAPTLTTRARLTHQVMEPYWQLNHNADDSLRLELDLPRMPKRR